MLPDLTEETSGEYGEVFTRRWVVETILDLAGYTSDRDLANQVAVEPACGSGAFLVPMIERLVESCRAHGRTVAEARNAIAATDLLSANVRKSRTATVKTLLASGVDNVTALILAAAWVQRRDFLLSPPEENSVDFVLGNPPYIRLEAVPRERSEAYRRACTTMSGRADVYVGFYENGLRALRDQGVLGFICADRWMRNAYGAKLRQLISSEWAVETLVSMNGVDAFEHEVDAYPAITVIRRSAQSCGPVVVEATAALDAAGARALTELAGSDVAVGSGRGYSSARLERWFSGTAAWPSGSPDRLALLSHLEASFPPLENADTGTRVGIGVATGADRVYVVRDPDVVESSRLLPLALPRDISAGVVRWSGSYLVNPWEAEGLVDLDRWPQLRRYLTTHEQALRKRHTAKSGQWYRTIDRVVDGLAERHKLYLPDFKEATFPVLDEGATYPHHNLYWITSDSWDLRVLGGLLLSDVANLFIEAYSVRMRGGYLRFQAQYLRRIRLPSPKELSDLANETLIDAFLRRDRAAATAAALPLYGLDAIPE